VRVAVRTSALIAGWVGASTRVLPLGAYASWGAARHTTTGGDIARGGQVATRERSLFISICRSHVVQVRARVRHGLGRRVLLRKLVARVGHVEFIAAGSEKVSVVSRGDRISIEGASSRLDLLNLCLLDLFAKVLELPLEVLILDAQVFHDVVSLGEGSLEHQNILRRSLVVLHQALQTLLIRLLLLNTLLMAVVVE